MIKKLQIKHTITASLIVMIASGCASNSQIYAIEDRLNNRDMRLLNEIYGESHVLQTQILTQKEQMNNISSLLKRLEEKLYGVRFRVTPTLIQMLHDSDDLNQLNTANQDNKICPELLRYQVGTLR